MTKVCFLKVCRLCKLEKPSSAFYKRNDYDGVRSECKACQSSNATKYNKTPKGKEIQRRIHLKARFGITVEDWDRMFAEQGGSCAICKTKDPGAIRFSVDHDHETGRVRALLCTTCNVRLGVLENAEFVKQASKYKERFKCEAGNN